MSEELDARIAEIAKRAAPVFAANGWVWGVPGQPLRVPTTIEITASIRELLADLTPGNRIEAGRLIVEWPTDGERGGEPEPRRVLLDLGALEDHDPGERRE